MIRLEAALSPREFNSYCLFLLQTFTSPLFLQREKGKCKVFPKIERTKYDRNVFWLNLILLRSSPDSKASRWATAKTRQSESFCFWQSTLLMLYFKPKNLQDTTLICSKLQSRLRSELLLNLDYTWKVVNYLTDISIKHSTSNSYLTSCIHWLDNRRD